MVKLFITFWILLSSPVYCEVGLKNNLNQVMTDYLTGLKSKNKKLIKQATSKKYFDYLEEKKLLEIYFKKQTPGEVSTFDFTFKPLAKEKNAFFVNIKDPKTKSYSDYWFVLRKINGKYVIDSSVFLD